MKKKILGNIAPLKVDNVKGSYKFKVAVDIVDAGGEKCLVVDFYKVPLRTNKLPVLRIFMTAKDSINRTLDGEWNTKGLYTKKYRWLWSEVTDIDTSYDHKELYISDESKEKINVFYKSVVGQLPYSYENWVQKLGRIKDKIYIRKITARDNRKEAVMMERVNSLKEPSQEFIDWGYRHLTLNYIYYKRKGNYVTCTCSECGGVYTRRCVASEDPYTGENIVPIPKQDKATECELCKTKGFYKCYGRYKKGQYCQERYMYLIENHKGEAVLRYFRFSKVLRTDCAAVYSYNQRAAAYVTKKSLQLYWKFSNGWSWSNPGHSMSPETLKDGYLYYKSDIEGTPLEYSEILNYGLLREFSPLWYIKTYLRCPDLEMVVKLKMYKLARGLISGNVDTYPGVKVHDRLGIRKTDMKKLIECRGDVDVLKVMHFAKAHNINFRDEEIEQIAVHRAHVLGDSFVLALRYMSVGKFIRTIEKYAGCKFNVSCDAGFGRVNSIITTYLDYIHLRGQLHDDLDNDVRLYPRKLDAAHHDMVRENNDKLQEEYIREKEKKYKDIRKVYRSLCKKYKRELGEMVIRPARSAEEIIMEGRLLHHCVGGDNYLKKHNEGDSRILFLRFSKQPLIPYVTIEIRKDQIVQWYGVHDTKPDKEVNEKILEEYVKLLKAV